MSKKVVIKKSQTNAEAHFWRGEPLLPPFPLTLNRVVTEVVGLFFCKMMGVRTPKTYVAQVPYGPIIMSHVRPNWRSCRLDPEYYFDRQLPPIPMLPGLAELELASAVIADIDVLGWDMGNLGIQTEGETEYLTKHDAGNCIVESERYEYYRKYFVDSGTLDRFPEGTMTLADDPELKGTYLKVFREPSVINYHLHYRDVFAHITPEMRRHALRKLFSISANDIHSMVTQIGTELSLPSEKTKEIIEFINNRLEVFRKKYAWIIEREQSPDSFVPCAKGLPAQTRIMRDEEYVLKRYKPLPNQKLGPNYSDYRFFEKLPEGAYPDQKDYIQEIKSYLR